MATLITAVPLRLILSVAIVLAGCDAPPTTTSVSPPVPMAEPTSRAIATSSQPADSLTPAQRVTLASMRGRWVVDVDATIAESAEMPNDALARAIDDLRQYPFTLELTENRYISRSREKTIADHYKVYDVYGHTAVLTLDAIDGRRERDDRQARLTVRGDLLLIGSRGPFTVALRRVRSAGG